MTQRPSERGKQGLMQLLFSFSGQSRLMFSFFSCQGCWFCRGEMESDWESNLQDAALCFLQSNHSGGSIIENAL